MNKILAAALLLIAGLSMSAHASLISGPITFDGGKSVDLQGLEWMPLTHTAGLSRVEVESGFSDVTKLWGTGGWRYATRVETEFLLGSLWGGNYDGLSHDNHAGAETFLALFGALYGGVSGSQLYSYFMFGADGDCHLDAGITCLGYTTTVVISQGVLSSPDRRANWNLTAAAVAGQSAGYFSRFLGANTGREVTNYTHSINQAGLQTVGSLLVRSVDAPVATVSSPGALSLFALGLCSLLLRRRKIAA